LVLTSLNLAARLIADRYEQLVEAKFRELFGADHTYTSPSGAELNAALIVTGLKMIKGHPLDRYLSARGKASSS
jgi:glycine/serine hydroxymethyltransferase